MIEVKAIKKYYTSGEGFFSRVGKIVKAVDGVSFSVKAGSTFGLVGESGCGKSTIAKMLVNIIKPDSGSVEIEGRSDIVFQDPFSALNPRMTVRQIIGEALLVRGEKEEDIRRRVKETLSSVKLYSPGIEGKFPHEFSGGQRQRIAIARSLITRPAVLVLDEPVSNLDVSIQAGILNLLKDLQDESGLTYVFISHDLRVVEFMSDIVGVMKEGQLVEIAPKEEIYTSPKTEYTLELLRSI